MSVHFMRSLSGFNGIHDFCGLSALGVCTDMRTYLYSYGDYLLKCGQILSVKSFEDWIAVASSGAFYCIGLLTGFLLRYETLEFASLEFKFRFEVC